MQTFRRRLEWAADDARELYFDATRPLRRLAGRLRHAVAPGTLTRCMRCDAVAQWHYDPGQPVMYYCDDCVPRGCDCNIIGERPPSTLVIEKGADGQELIWNDYGEVEPEQEMDGRGRLVPCREFYFRAWGFPRRFEDSSPL